MKRFAASVVFLVCILPLCYGQKVNEPMVIDSLQIDCKITFRFARTFITTKVYNQLNISREAVFDVELPKTAFITKFSMTVDGVTTDGTVKEKAKAEKQYQTAVSRGQSAGLVQSTGRKMEQFKMSVNVAGFSNTTFKLIYEELLKRHLGKYEFNVRVKPKQLVEHFEINADIVEPQGISFLNVDANFGTNDLKDVVELERTETKAHITFKPSLDQQRKCPSCTETLLDGNFAIKYDVNRDNSAGNIQIVNGYFVHYFAPASLKNVPKNVVFVIDRSGSMSGTKIKQTYEAFLQILDDMPVEDHFGIITFDDKIEYWKNTMVTADSTNIAEAKKYVTGIHARGLTDINAALLEAAAMLKKATKEKALPEISTSLILFLSDGDPTSGVTDLNRIVRNAKEAVGGDATLYCLGFGRDLDYSFLEKLSQENGGLARRIYEDSDAALQLKGFYNEVAYPMLLDVEIQYLDNSIEYLTQNNFRHYYQGSEIIVAGHIGNNDLKILTCQVTGQGETEKFFVNVDAKITEVNEEQDYIFSGFTERLWAYLTIEQLLTKQSSAEGEEKTNITDKALELSLKYSFVTPLTSMVVTNPEDEDKSLVANKPKEGAPAMPAPAFPAPAFPAHGIPGGGAYGIPGGGVSYMLSIMRPHPRPPFFSRDPDLIFPVKVLPGNYRPRPVDRVVIIDSTEDDEFEYEDPFLPKFAAPFLPPTTAIPATTPSTGCFHDFVLLRVPMSQQYVCLHFDVDQSNIINLLHNSSTGFILNGNLSAANKANFEGFGLIKNKNKVEITAKEIRLIRGKIVVSYGWKNSFDRYGFLKKEGNKLTISLENDAALVITLLGDTGTLGLFVENKHSLSSGYTGLLGLLINDFIPNSDIGLNVIKKTYSPDQRRCDFTPYGLERGGSCQDVTVKPNEVINGNSNVVSDIFEVPGI